MRLQIGSKIAVKLGASYRGIDDLSGQNSRAGCLSLPDLYTYVWPELLAFNNNDFASYGLWTFHIPTLNYFGTTVTPQYYLMRPELLARGSDRQLRSFTIVTVPNEAILKLWGVRFVIADYKLPFGIDRINMPVAVMTDWFPKNIPACMQEFASIFLCDCSNFPTQTSATIRRPMS